MSNKTFVRILIVDDHQMVRRGLKTFLHGFDNISIVGEAENGQEAVTFCAEVDPDIVLMDIKMPTMDGITATRIIHESHPQIKIIALTSSSDMESVVSMMQSGAISYLLKNASDDQILNTIQLAKKGERSLSPEATEALIDASAQPSFISYHLTERELDILRLLTRGMSNPAMAEELVISKATVKYHVSNIFSKLGVSNRFEAIALAFKHQLV